MPSSVACRGRLVRGVEAPYKEGNLTMPVRYNHTILAARDKFESARFFTDLFDLPDAEESGFFTVVRLADDQLLQFAEPPVEEIQMQHHAFLVDEATFDHLLARLQAQDLPHWADPLRQQPGINTNHGGRGVYFMDPAGHGLEAITTPYAD
jgi:catechol 2,3-dioxygenase-like lactoylglutathione lyase family enzyme